MNYRDKIFNLLGDMFVGEKIEGQGGFINLMKFKQKYYDEVFKTKLEEKIKEASIEELMSIKGIGLAKATQIKAALELGRRAELTIETHKRKILSPEDVFKLMKSKLKDYSKEHFYIIALTTRNTVICEISIGTLNSSLVHPREVFSEAIRHKANSIILIHNHPSNDPTSSKDDIEITKRLIESCKILDIEIIDHIIINKKTTISVLKRGN